MLRGESACTIIVSRPLCIHRSIPSSTRRTRRSAQPPISRCVCVGALQARRSRDDGRPAGRRGLTIVGDGPERAHLERLAGNGIELVGWLHGRRDSRAVSHLDRHHPSRAKRTSASCRSRRRPADGRSSRSAAAARSTPSIDGETGVLVRDPSVDALADGMRRGRGAAVGCAAIRRARRTVFPRRASCTAVMHVVDDTMAAPAGHDGKAPQPAAGRVPRRHRRRARHGGVPVRVFAALRHRPHPDHPTGIRRSSSTSTFCRSSR